MEAREHTQSNLQLLREKLDSGRMRSARLMVHSLHPAEIARLLESLPLQERALLWEMVAGDDEGDVLVELSDEVRDGLIEGMQTDELIAATEGMEFDDLADLLADLPEVVTKQVLQSLDKADHDRLQQVLAYDEDSAGGLMNVDIVTVRPDVTLEVVARYLRKVAICPDGTDLIFVVNRDNEYVGSLFLSRLLTQMPTRWCRASCRPTFCRFRHTHRRSRSCGSSRTAISCPPRSSTTTIASSAESPSTTSST